MNAHTHQGETVDRCSLCKWSGIQSRSKAKRTYICHSKPIAFFYIIWFADTRAYSYTFYCTMCSVIICMQSIYSLFMWLQLRFMHKEKSKLYAMFASYTRICLFVLNQSFLLCPLFLWSSIMLPHIANTHHNSRTNLRVFSYCFVWLVLSTYSVREKNVVKQKKKKKKKEKRSKETQNNNALCERE